MSKIPFLRRPRFAAAFVLIVALFFVAHPTQHTIRLGGFFILLGEMIRVWANGYVGHRKVNWTAPDLPGSSKIGTLITAGPYAFVRHPLYFGTLLLGVGLCVIVGNPLLALAALGSFHLFYGQKIADEEQTLSHEWGEQFERYRVCVPRWFPGLKHYSHPEGQWSWEGIAASKEWKTAVWVIAGVIALYLREEIFQEQEFFMRHELRHWIFAGFLGLLIAGMGLLELRRNP